MKKLLMVMACCILAVVGCAFMPQAQSSAIVAPEALTVEYMQNPVGLDTLAPRLSWKLKAIEKGARDLRQTAFQVLVASSLTKLDRDEGDLWDSGRVDSDQSLNVIYGGTALKSSQRCYWKIRAWDNTSKRPSAWSLPGRWIMGVMHPQDWQAKWIGANAVTRPDFDLAGAQWIFGASAKKQTFEKVFKIAEDFAGKTGFLALTGDEKYEVFINGKSAVKTWGHLNNPKQIRFVEVTKFLQAGDNRIKAVVENTTGRPAGFLATLRLNDASIVVTDASWAEVTRTCGADLAVHGKLERRVETSSPAFEKSFAVAQKVRMATLHITGVGFYEASLNGSKIGRKVLDPAPTKFDKRVLYSTYDLTEQLKPGKNRLGVLLGHGWYDVRSVAVWNFDNAMWRDFPRMIAQLEIVYEDGTREVVVSDATWRQVASPLGFDCIREGEVIGQPPPRAIDLNKTQIMAEVVSAPAGRLTASALPPSVIAEELKPIAIKNLRPGVWMVDFGQNTAGWVRLKIRGQKAGDIITVKYGEKVNADGTLSLKGTDAHFRYPASFNVLPGGWFQVDRFVCDGSAEQVYEPRFTYNGFQYVELHGLYEAPTADTLSACVVHTDFTRAGSFACGDELLNKLQQAILWAYRSNFVNGYPTDCPHREKNGWTGDAHLAVELAMYNFQNTAAYEKWIGDIIDEQRPDGNVAAIIPTSGWGYEWGNGPAWDSALLIIPWTLYVYQGDTRLLETAYEAMRKYVDYMTARAQSNLVSHGLGDWTPVKTVTPVEVTSSGYYYLDAQIVARSAEILGKTEDAKKYAALATAIRSAYTQRLYKGAGAYSIGSQTSQSCALHQGLVLPAERERVEAKLVEAVQAHKGYPDFGILGSKYVFRALSAAGRSDLAFAMAKKEDGSSYGSWIKRGATTFWEDWEEGASRNHVMFGDISAWFYQYLGGIRLADGVSAIADVNAPAKVAFKEFVVSPDPVEGLGWVVAEHDSPYGRILSSWKKEGGVFTLEIDVPVNTSAMVLLPVRPDAKNVVADVKPMVTTGDRMAFKVGSGHYTFVAR